MADDSQQNPVEQLIELFVYAPVGLIYEYQEVIPQLVKRGKSQVQLAKVLGQMAAKQGQQATLGDQIGEMLTGAATLLGGTTTPKPARPVTGRARTPATASSPAAEVVPEGTDETDSSEAEADVSDVASLPIAGYDDLTAKQIIPLLGDLTGAQRARIETYEAAGRKRKTVLGKLASLADA